ncbi:histone deacetylase 5-like isoform X1 [Canna indica]|uniref:histone deacetylase n=1 Tax=Canna indica TaxID=4628 RepID=A0AAQ3L2F2_9LILI|nr:histone deacetylase 5-like isoform X1 [Canna indica]
MHIHFLSWSAKAQTLSRLFLGLCSFRSPDLSPRLMAPPPDDIRRLRVGLLYDERMCLHTTPDGEIHPECPDRIRAIWNKLNSEGIPQRCIVLDAKKAKDKHIAHVHTLNHIKLIKNISSKEFDSRRQRIASKFNSIYLNQGSSEAAYLAAGSVIEVAEKVAKGDLNSGIAIVRPPGHHAEPDEAMGFCLFNNVAIAASFLLNEKPELGIRKILIVDWDVHHGNGTQKVFYDDPRVLFFSVHRFDSGSFYPAGDDGAYFMIGEGAGAGYNINIPWEHGQCGDADYFAVWDHVLIPIAEAYNPDIILVSAGFDAAIGDPLGGCCVTPYGYSVLLEKLMRFAQGKIVMALEGGYNLKSIANSVLACAKVLLHEEYVGSTQTPIFESTWHVIETVRHELKGYWPVLNVELPQSLLLSNSRPRPPEVIYSSSESDVENDEEVSTAHIINNEESAEDNLILPLSKLKIDEDNHEKLHASKQVQIVGSSTPSEACHDAQELAPNNTALCGFTWRSLLSGVEVWYATYGSNMWKPRFLCYIEGGKVDGMSTRCCGSLDKSSPKQTIWKVVPHRLLFGRSYTRTWGEGGVAFLNPERGTSDRAYLCIYRITLEQFNDVLFQENSLHQEDATLQGLESPLLDLGILDYVVKNKSLPLETLKNGWYSTVLFLGKEDELPILTMTCSASDVERFKSGKVPTSAPSEPYMNTLVNGLVEGKQLTKEEAIAYVNDAASRRDYKYI